MRQRHLFVRGLEVYNSQEFQKPFSLRSPGAGVGVTPREIGWGCVARFPKPLPYL